MQISLLFYLQFPVFLFNLHLFLFLRLCLSVICICMCMNMLPFNSLKNTNVWISKFNWFGEGTKKIRRQTKWTIVVCECILRLKRGGEKRVLFTLFQVTVHRQYYFNRLRGCKISELKSSCAKSRKNFLVLAKPSLIQKISGILCYRAVSKYSTNTHFLTLPSLSNKSTGNQSSSPYFGPIFLNQCSPNRIIPQFFILCTQLYWKNVDPFVSNGDFLWIFSFRILSFASS